MLSGDFDSNPEVREAFFCFARALTHSCFSAVLALTAEQTELFVQSLFFGIRHSTRGVRDDALRALMELVTNWEHSSTDFHTRRNAFFQAYYFRMLQAVLVVLTDSSHRPAFKLHAALLRALLALGVSDTVPTIWDREPPAPPATRRLHQCAVHHAVHDLVPGWTLPSHRRGTSAAVRLNSAFSLPGAHPCLLGQLRAGPPRLPRL
eukprot:gnl/Ergobibamus_cyprinoides/1715.p1 GENE.gnl/Ergobibamus_cyprinoides/1715~~gnl/Ergobibamus_cyprinoides/1715.p1  ORF type:complete len:206 (+),score=37.22 gnl/Ergobibamus_cyprinoides/1715:269-886(+)